MSDQAHMMSKFLSVYILTKIDVGKNCSLGQPDVQSLVQQCSTTIEAKRVYCFIAVLLVLFNN
jgi:hypothetical protein